MVERAEDREGTCRRVLEGPEGGPDGVGDRDRAGHDEPEVET